MRPGGTLVIAHFDWIPLPGNVAEATERLIETHNPAWTMGGRIRASAGVGASLAPEAVERFDGELATLLADRFPEDPLAVPHRCFALVCRAP